MRWHIDARACAALFAVVATVAGQRAPAPFAVEETTIAQIHAAMRDRRLTCHALVDAYLKLTDAYDKQGPAINAIVVVNPSAMKEADELDRRFAQSGAVGPLHCIPAIVKDNFETIGLQSADGSLSLQGFVSNKDAFLVRRIKEAGAIVLAKSNMAEFAFSPYETVNSLLPGYSRNPYALHRVTAGSTGRGPPPPARDLRPSAPRPGPGAPVFAPPPPPRPGPAPPRLRPA